MEPQLARQSAGQTPVITIIVALVIFVLSRGYILFQLTPQVTDVPNSYFQHAAQVIDGHFAPYQKPPEGVEIEYPPLAWWITCLPRLFDDRQIVDQETLKLAKERYHTTYRVLMFLCDLACFPLLLAIAWKRRYHLSGWVVLIYTLCTACLGHLLYDRLDIALLLLLLSWAYCWIRSLDAPVQSLGWTAAAYALLGLSISFKLIPVVGAPFLLLSEWHVPRRTIRLVVGLLCLAVGAGLPFLIQYGVSGSAVFSVFGHHAERGIQIESLYAGIILLASFLGSPTSIGNTHGAFEVFCDWSPAMKTLSTVLLPAFLGATGLWALLRWSHYRREDSYCTACFVIAAVVILSNVFSPQYLIWAIPMMLLIAIERLPERPSREWVLFGLIMAMVLLTTWLFPFNYYRTTAQVPIGGPYGLVPDGRSFTSPSLVACLVLVVRNALYLGIVVWLGAMLFKRPAGELAARTSVAEKIRSPADQASGRGRG